jgi:hypothetical protein
MELRAGIVEGRWTPLAARQAAFVVAHLTPQEGEDLFILYLLKARHPAFPVPGIGEPGLHGCNALGRYRMNMSPSKSSLDRLPKQLSERWEAERERFEAALCAEQTVPREAVTVAISLDGVIVQRQLKLSDDDN